MRTKTVTNGEISITVSESTIESEVRRGWLADEGIKAEDADPIIRMMHTFTWPTFAACVVAAEGVELPISFEAFRTMRGTILSDWADAVYELNPTWRPESATPDPKASKPTKSAVTNSVEG